MQKDPIVEEIRKGREEYAKRFNYDLDAMYVDIKRREDESTREKVSREPKPPDSVRKTA